MVIVIYHINFHSYTHRT